MVQPQSTLKTPIQIQFSREKSLYTYILNIIRVEQMLSQCEVQSIRDRGRIAQYCEIAKET